MSLSIRPVDPWDEDEMDVLQALYVEAQRAEVPDARVYSRADSVALLRRTEGGVFYHAFAALEGDQMVGQTWVVGSTIDNLHLRPPVGLGASPLRTARGRHRAGRGHAEQHLRDLGRRTAVTQTWIGDGGTAATEPSPSGSATPWRRPRSSAVSGCRWTRRRWPASRRRPAATARRTRCAPSSARSPTALVRRLRRRSTTC